MKKRLFNIILISIIFSFMLGMQAKAQTQKTNKVPFEFEHAFQLQKIGEYSKAIKKYREVQLAHPGTDIALRCQQRIQYLYAELGKRDESIRENLDIINKYPGTPAAVGARGRINEMKYLANDFDMWLKKTDEHVVELGGISYKEILNGNYEFDSRTRIPEKLRFIVGNIYDSMASSMSDQSMRPSDKLRYDDSIKIYVFIRENFPDYRYNVTESIFENICEKKGIYKRSHFPLDVYSPGIRPIAPHDELEIGETRPKIEVELEDGDFSQSMVNLTKIIFTLDGRDLTKEMKIKSTINTSGQLGVTFEKLRLSYRPATPLSQGWHTVYIKAIDNAKHPADKTWRFYVKK